MLIGDLYRAGCATEQRVDRARSLYEQGAKGRALAAAGLGGLHAQGRAARWTGGHATIVSGLDVWKGIRTPGQIRDEVRRIDGEVKATGADLADLLVASPSNDAIKAFFDSVWQPFLFAWGPFAAEHEDWSSNLWGSTWDQAQDFQRQLVDIRGKAKGLGFELKSADPVVAPRSGIEEAIAAIWGLATTVVYVGLAGAGIWLLVTAWRALRGGL